MGYIERNLIDGEVLIFKTRWHFIGSIFVGFIVLAVSLMMGSLSRDYGIAIALFGVIYVYLLYSKTELAVTNRRILAIHWEKRGRFTNLDLNKIKNVSINQGTIGKKLGYGEIILIFIDGSRVNLWNVPNPIAFQQRILEQMARIK